MPRGKLTPKQTRFCKEFSIDLNATAAAKRAGYSMLTAHKIGTENLQKPLVAEQIQKELKTREKRTEINADHVLTELKGLATFDPKDFLGKDLTVRSFDDIPETARKAIKSFKIKQTPDGGKEIRVAFYDRIAALELLGRHVGMFDSSKFGGKEAPQVNFVLNFGTPGK